MKRIKATVAVWILFVIITFIAFCFSQWSMDAGKWPHDVRAACAGVMFGISTFVAMMVYSFPGWNDND